MPFNLNEFEPINEINKPEMIAWLTDTLNILTDPNFQGWNQTRRNRIFGTERDDIDETIDMFGRFLTTLVNCNIFIK